MATAHDTKIMLLNLAALCIGLMPAQSSIAQWIELQTAYSYRNTDFFINDLDGYQIAEVGGRVGLDAIHLTSSASLQPYIAGFAIRDVGNEVWNEVDWHNNMVYGLGIQLRLNPGSLLFLRPREFNLELFAENYWIYYFPTDAFFTGARPSSDFRAGLRFWMALGGGQGAKKNQGLRSLLRFFWLDTAGGLSYSESSFFAQSQTGFYLLSLHSRLGPGVPVGKRWSLQAFITYHLIADLGNESWNKLDWHNRHYYGGGVRLRYARFPRFQRGNLNVVVESYLELLDVRYLDKVSYIPSYRPEHDIQFGLSIWLSLARRRR